MLAANTPQDTLYFINASVGNPPQDLHLHLDTGSSDMWVNTADSELCSLPEDPCEAGGTYDQGASSTAKDAGSGFNISYADGSGAAGGYVTDTFRLGSVSIDDFQFGVGDESSSPRGILGIGYANNEVQVLRDGEDPYDNLPLRLASEGHIQSAAYSIYLNDLDARRGSILFGGVDAERYEGDLETLPVESEGGDFTRLLVTLTKLEFGGETVQDDMALAVLLDSGSSISYLPGDVVSPLYEAAGASFSQEAGLAFVPCSARDDSKSVDFTFTSPTISVPMDELVLDLSSGSGRGGVELPDGEDACVFGIAPAGEGTSVLGDTFMRSAYVVFDLENNEISIAQTRLNSSKSDVREIKAGKDGVPGAKKVEDPVQATTGLQDDGESVGAGAACSLAGTAAVALLATLAVW